VIRESRCRPLLAAALPTNRIVPTDLERCREGEQGRRQMLEVAEADLDLEAGFVHVKGAPGMPQITRRACRRERSAFRGFTMARGSRRARPGCTELAVDGGPRVRIHLPPAASQVRTCLSRECAFLGQEAAVFRGCAGRGERRGRQRRAGRGNIGPTGGNISVGPYSSTAPPVMWAA
jgi:hypothetical protein